MLCDGLMNCSVISWSSAKLRRVVRSALGAETLSMCDGCEQAFSVCYVLENMLCPTSKMPVFAITDSRSLYEHLGTTKQAENKRLRVEISALREMISEEDIRLLWVEGAKQLSNPLTKRGTSWTLLHQVLQSGILPSE